jgi:hypothetical protein
MLRFDDNTQVAVNGLTETMADLYSEGKQANKETAKEIIKRLEALNNYIPPSDRIRKEFVHILLKEYQEYLENRKEIKPCRHNSIKD